MRMRAAGRFSCCCAFWAAGNRRRPAFGTARPPNSRTFRRAPLDSLVRGPPGAVRIGTPSQRNVVCSTRGPTEGPPLKWKATGLGGGYSSVAIDSGRIFTMGKLKDGCNVLALNFANGRGSGRLRTGDGDPNSTPTVDGDRVYALDRDGTLVCLDVSSGRLIWSKSLTTRFRRDA